MDSTGDVARQVRWLCDLQEIYQLKARYAELCDKAVRLKDRVAGVALAALFTEDATIDLGLPQGPIVGRAAIESFYGEVLPATVSWTWHASLAPVVVVEGNTASGNWVIHASSTFPSTPHAPPLITYGRYVDEYVRTTSGWKQSRLKFFNETPPATL